MGSITGIDSAKDILKRLNDKTQLSDLAFSLFDILGSCREAIKYLKSECTDTRSIVARLTSIEKSIASTPATVIEANKKLATVAMETQQKIDVHNREMQSFVKSYSEAITSNSTQKPGNLVQIKQAVKQSIIEENSRQERSCNVMIFGDIVGGDDAEAYVHELVEELGL